MIGSNKKILITGINGFLGSHLAKKLLNYYCVYGLELNTNNLFRLVGSNLTVFSIDQDIEQLFIDYKFDIIIHAATIYKTNNNSLENLLQTNLILPIKLYELAIKYKASHFINTDSFFNDSNTTYNYLGEYTLSKKHLLEWLNILPSKTAIINMKLFHMYGPNDSNTKFVTRMVNELINNVPVIELTLGDQKRDFIHIDDVVGAFLKVLSSLDVVNASFTEFEVGTGNPTSIKDLVNTAYKIVNSNSKLIFGALPYREGEKMISIANNSELLKLGWSAKIDINHGLESIINFEKSKIN
jgi:nucleoside-diphosphate-sugar epimerase